ncbi:MAG: tyrosine-type recombinase/integrase [Desulfobacterales bacterium]|nr:tyrosine-type recombinase/integrase [Desulfobacterales bacterium]MDD4072904.1 tyrosine-type recombinase/integrase [Desulfobacterales bacterium]
MAINIRCRNCKTEMKLSAKKCPKCGSPIPKKGKTYKIIVRYNGRRVTRTATNLELAREIESTLKVQIAKKTFNLEQKKPAPTLNNVWRKYSPWAIENKKSWRTEKYYYQKHLEPLFGDKQLDDISPFDIEKLMLTMKKTKRAGNKSYAAATIKHQVVLLSRLYSLAEKWGLYAGANPCRKVKKPKLNNKKTEFLSDQELSRLMATLETWSNKMTVSIVNFAIRTGLRRGELMKLKWSDVDLVRKTVTLRDPKGQQDQTLPLSLKAVAVLHDVPKDYETEWIFYGKNGGKRTDFKGPWQRIKKAAELPDDFRFHGLRHHFASALVSSGIDLYTVQTLLSHKDASTTQRYAHLSDKALRDAVNISDDLLTPNKQAQVIKLEEKRNG